MLEWTPPRPHVHSIALELTGHCNQHCDYCYNPFREDHGLAIGGASLRELLARVDALRAAADLDHVTLTGGEPLAFPHLFELLDALRTRRLRAQIISNASLVDAETATRLARYRLLAMLVTLNGPDAATHDGPIRHEGNFARTVEGIRRLRAAKVPVEGSIVVTKDNADRVGETVALFATLGVKKVAISRFSPAGYAVAFKSLLPSPSDVVRALDGATAVAKTTQTYLFATMPIPPCVVDVARYPDVAFHDCPIGTPGQEFAVGVRGDLRHCPLHAAPLIDDVATASSAQLASAVREGDPHGYRGVLPSMCQGCEHVHRCAGGCRAAAWWVAGSVTEVDPFVAAAKPRRALPVVS